MGETFWKNYNQKIKSKKIKTRMIFNEELRNWSKEIKKINAETEIKFLKKHFDNITETFVLENIVIIIIWAYNPMGIIIREISVAKAYHHFFNILWKNSNH